jgi:hypothetical protein
MLDAFIIESIKERERRKEERRPMLRLPVYIDDGRGEGKGDTGDRTDDSTEGVKDESIVIDFS